ncbi:unnamed protein product [Clonostachys byssicola]|uniref:Uncharacterized protein n=1 Tax=Clonostachys byssicola TaxID=160290 RepID=A0A9N9U160_9HYPO|nr:unnamed protein product [Clonostachys byssicola]
MSETSFDELEELYKDLEALEEDLEPLKEELENLKKKLTCLGSHQTVQGIFACQTEPTKFIRHRVVLNRAIEEELKLERTIEEKGKLKNLNLVDEDLGKWHHDKERIDSTAEEVTSMSIKQNLEKELQTLKGQISDKEKEIDGKKEEIKEEKSLTKEQIKERGIKSYRL